MAFIVAPDRNRSSNRSVVLPDTAEASTACRPSRMRERSSRSVHSLQLWCIACLGDASRDGNAKTRGDLSRKDRNRLHGSNVGWRHWNEHVDPRLPPRQEGGSSIRDLIHDSLIAAVFEAIEQFAQIGSLGVELHMAEFVVANRNAVERMHVERIPLAPFSNDQSRLDESHAIRSALRLLANALSLYRRVLTALPPLEIYPATQLSKPRRSCGRFRLRPMNTSRLVRGASGAHFPMKSPSAIMCTAWKAKRRSSPA